jgi:hypothetical protein
MAKDKTTQELKEDVERKEKTAGSTSVYTAVALTVGVAGALASAPLAPLALVGAGVFGMISSRNNKSAQEDREEISRRGATQPPDYKSEGRAHAFEKYATHNWVKDTNTNN